APSFAPRDPPHSSLFPYTTLFRSLHVPLLARLAADAGPMQLITSVVLLALLNPVQVAEDIATLDVMCEGRLVFGIGLGYRDVEGSEEHTSELQSLTNILCRLPLEN